MLIVRTRPAGAKRARLGDIQRTPAHDVALCPMRIRKERTPTKRLDIVWDGGVESRPPHSYYTPCKISPLGDQDHVGAAPEGLTMTNRCTWVWKLRLEVERLGPSLNRLRSGLHSTEAHPHRAQGSRQKLPGV